MLIALLLMFHAAINFTFVKYLFAYSKIPLDRLFKSASAVKVIRPNNIVLWSSLFMKCNNPMLMPSSGAIDTVNYRQNKTNFSLFIHILCCIFRHFAYGLQFLSIQSRQFNEPSSNEDSFENHQLISFDEAHGTSIKTIKVCIKMWHTVGLISNKVNFCFMIRVLIIATNCVLSFN